MKMSSQFSRQNGKQKRFSIDDAFEEETDEAIKVYGITSPTTPNGKLGQGDTISVTIENGRGYKAVTDTSRDSDSLIQDYYDCSSEENLHRSCFMHPKVRENWRMVLAATTLFLIGTGLLVTGTLTLSEPNSMLQASVFLLAGFICFIPGAYHVVYIYLAAKGKRGYHFHNLPLFTKFIVHTCLLTFTIFFALRLDNYINWSFWTVFTPIWVWKALVICGATVGSYVWWRYPHFRLEGEAYIHYKSMLISLALHLILLMFELLVCDKLESSRHLWILVFIPLIFISIVSIAVCIWAVKHERSFELELFCAVNVLQFIFLALRLDGFIAWSWEVVFVPLWIVMCLSLVGVLYTIIFAAILLRTPEVNAQQRRSSFHSALGYTFLVIPILIFQVLLANKLDEDIMMSFTAVVSPLFISFITLILMSFSAKGSNKWWFGMRKDFCSFLLGACPLLQEYGNIAYQPERRPNGVELEQQLDKTDGKIKKADLLKPVLPIISIEMPD